MLKALFCGAVVAVAGSVSRGGEEGLPPLDRSATVFANIHVISPDGETMLLGRSVLVRDGRIERIVEGDLRAMEARVIDGRGEMYLIPGLSDMHVHFAPLPGERGDAAWRSAQLLLASGVTTARGMIGHPNHVELRRRIIAGEILGPTVYIAGPPVVAQVAKTPEQAAQMVREQKRQGFDLIKSHRVIAPDIFDAVQRAGAEEGIAVAGHVDNEVGLDRALASRMQMEHLDGWLAELLTEPALKTTFGQMIGPHLKGKFDEAKIPGIAAKIAELDRWSTPTLALFEMIADTRTPTKELRERAEMRYIPAQALSAWSQQRDGMIGQGLFADAELAAEFTDLRRRIVRGLQSAGAGLMAGSDSPQAFLIVGDALHRELAALQRAGLTPAQTLRTATANPARYLSTLPDQGSAAGVPADFGILAEGKRADLVLLLADPLEDVGHARQIEGVMVRGKWLDRAALDAMLEEVAQAAAG